MKIQYQKQMIKYQITPPYHNEDDLNPNTNIDLYSFLNSFARQHKVHNSDNPDLFVVTGQYGNCFIVKGKIKLVTNPSRHVQCDMKLQVEKYSYDSDDLNLCVWGSYVDRRTKDSVQVYEIIHYDHLSTLLNQLCQLSNQDIPSNCRY